MSNGPNSIIVGEENALLSLDFKTNAQGISVVGAVKTYETYPDFLRDNTKGVLAYVKDATADPTVMHGGAVYKIKGSEITKLYEEESLESAENIILLNANIDVILAKIAEISAKEMKIVFTTSSSLAVSPTRWYIPSSGGCKFGLPETGTNGELIRFTIFPDAVGSYDPQSQTCNGSQLLGVVNNHNNILLEDPCTITLIYRNGWQILEKNSIDFIYEDH